MTRLRQTLSDSAENPRCIATVARRGYRFLMPVERSAETNGDVEADVPAETPAAPSTHPIVEPLQSSRSRVRLALNAGLFVLATLLGLVLALRDTPQPGNSYIQLTDFTDSAISPAISPDGRTVAFLRSADWFLSRGQIWLKSLPDGEPVQLTNDPRVKFAPAFSPDGSQVAYSIVIPSRTEWDTVAVPIVGGGEPRLLLGPRQCGGPYMAR